MHTPGRPYALATNKGTGYHFEISGDRRRRLTVRAIIHGTAPRAGRCIVRRFSTRLVRRVRDAARAERLGEIALWRAFQNPDWAPSLRWKTPLTIHERVPMTVDRTRAQVESGCRNGARAARAMAAPFPGRPGARGRAGTGGLPASRIADRRPAVGRKGNVRRLEKKNNPRARALRGRFASGPSPAHHTPEHGISSPRYADPRALSAP